MSKFIGDLNKAIELKNKLKTWIDNKYESIAWVDIELKANDWKEKRIHNQAQKDVLGELWEVVREYVQTD